MWSGRALACEADVAVGLVSKWRNRLNATSSGRWLRRGNAGHRRHRFDAPEPVRTHLPRVTSAGAFDRVPPASDFRNVEIPQTVGDPE